MPRCWTGSAPDRPGARGFAGSPTRRRRSIFALIIVGGVVRISDSGLGCGAGRQRHRGLAAVRRRCRARDRHPHDRRVLAPRPGRRSSAILVALPGAGRVAQRAAPSACSCASSIAALRADPGPGGARRADRREGPRGGAGRDPPRRRDAPDRAGAADGAARAAPEERRPPAAAPGAHACASRRSRWRSVLVLATIVAGGYMAASELDGTGRRARARSMRTWPAATSSRPAAASSCRSARSRAMDIHLTHRAFMYLASTAILRAVRGRAARSAAGSTRARGDTLALMALGVTAVLAAQVMLGAMNVWLGEHEWLIVAHLTVGTLLWVMLVAVHDAAAPCTSASPAGARRRRRQAAAWRRRTPDGSRRTARTGTRPPRGCTSRARSPRTTSRSRSRASSRCCW